MFKCFHLGLLIFGRLKILLIKEEEDDDDNDADEKKVYSTLTFPQRQSNCQVKSCLVPSIIHPLLSWPCYLLLVGVDVIKADPRVSQQKRVNEAGSGTREQSQR